MAIDRRCRSVCWQCSRVAWRCRAARAAGHRRWPDRRSRFRAARRQPLRPPGMQRGRLPRLVSRQRRLSAEPVRPVAGDGLCRGSRRPSRSRFAGRQLAVGQAVGPREARRRHSTSREFLGIRPDPSLDRQRRSPHAGRGAVQALARSSLPASAAGGWPDRWLPRDGPALPTGDDEDVTALAEFRSRDETVAEIDPRARLSRPAGRATRRSSISYRGIFASAAADRSLRRQSNVATPTTGNLIDQELDAKLARLGPDDFAAGDGRGIPAAGNDRRAGHLAQRRTRCVQFLRVMPIRRSAPKKIDALLAHPRRAALWATRMCDITAATSTRWKCPKRCGPSGPRCGTTGSGGDSRPTRPTTKSSRGVLLATSRDEQASRTPGSTTKSPT